MPTSLMASTAHGSVSSVGSMPALITSKHNLEAIPRQVAQEPLGHLAPCRVLRAQEQHLLLPHRYPPFTSSACTRSLIRSRTLRKTSKRSSSEPSALEGSSKDQCSLLWAPGKNGQASFASSQTVITLSKCSCRYRFRVLDCCSEMSIPITCIALMACGLTRVASVPALIASKRSLARWRSSPSAICERAELWVQRNRTLLLCGASAAVTDHAPLFGIGEKAVGGLAEQLAGCLPIEGVEGPLPAPLLAHQPGVLEFLHVVGDLRLAHAEDLLELADADALLPLVSRDARTREVAAATLLGHHGEHSYPYGVRQGAAQGDEPIHALVAGVAVLLNDPELPGTHGVLPTGLRPLMKALASGTSAAAVVAAVSPQQPDLPQHAEASVTSSP